MTSAEARESGYTLAEALAALLIVGLAVGGLTEGARAIGRMQKPTVTAVAEVRMQRRAEAALEGLLAARPADDRSLVGDARGFAFDCPGGCAAELKDDKARTLLVVRQGATTRRFPLPVRDRMKLLYDAQDGRYDHWPPSGGPKALRGVAAVATTASGETSVLAVSSWIEQPKTCEFDMIVKGCRSSEP